MFQDPQSTVYRCCTTTLNKAETHCATYIQMSPIIISYRRIMRQQTLFICRYVYHSCAYSWKNECGHICALGCKSLAVSVSLMQVHNRATHHDASLSAYLSSYIDIMSHLVYSDCTCTLFRTDHWLCVQLPDDFQQGTLTSSP
jgi:hypothetical protein